MNSEYFIYFFELVDAFKKMEKRDVSYKSNICEQDILRVSFFAR